MGKAGGKGTLAPSSGTKRPCFPHMTSEVWSLGLLVLFSVLWVSLLRCFMNRGRNLTSRVMYSSLPWKGHKFTAASGRLKLD